MRLNLISFLKRVQEEKMAGLGDLVLQDRKVNEVILVKEEFQAMP